jgi:hypothetical protein
MSAQDKGAALERSIEQFFIESGYETQRNVILEGRSGGRHEIDVLASKADGVTTIRIFVECKAWNSPIEKDVVTKAAYVMGDLGFNKAIVVSLAGCRVGAEQSAEQLGVDLWDTFEIEKRLGKVAVSGLQTAGGGRGARSTRRPARRLHR